MQVKNLRQEPVQSTEEQLSTRHLVKEMSLMNAKLDILTNMISDAVSGNNSKDNVRQASMDTVLNMLESSGLDKHPQFAKMMEPIKEMMKAQQG